MPSPPSTVPTRTPLHTLHIVSGKGGTGKTTMAGALACALAAAGRRVLVCEVEGRDGLTRLFGTTPLKGAEERRLCRTPAGGEVFGLSVDAEDALLEYLETFYHLGIAGRALDRFGAIDFATSIAPGLRDVLLTGKVYEAVRRQIKGRPNAYHAVVVDAPPTGRIAQFLNVHEAVAGLARMGPIRGQADSIMRLLRSVTTAVHLVTLLEDMPVTETEEAIEALRPTQIRLGVIIANQVRITPLSDDQLRAAATGETMLEVPGLEPAQNKLLTEEFAGEAGRMLAERARRAKLLETGLPVVDVRLESTGIDTDAVWGIAAQLAEQFVAKAGDPL